MKRTTERLHIPLESSNPIPTEFRILASGTTRTAKGAVHLDGDSSRLALSAFSEQGNDLMVDYEHKSLNPNAPPGAGKAAAWFKLEERDGDLWASNVDWTPQASKELSDKEWRYFSPAIELDEKRRVVRVINVALTNLPAITALDPLMAHNADASAFATVVGLSETAEDAEVIDAISGLKKGNAEVLALTGAVTIDQAKGLIAAWKASHERLSSVQEELAKVTAATERAELLSLVETGKKNFKLTPALAEWALSQPVATVRQFLEFATPNEILSRIPEQEPARGNEAAPEEIAAILEKPFSELSNMQKHTLYMFDATLYAAKKEEDNQ